MTSLELVRPNEPRDATIWRTGEVTTRVIEDEASWDAIRREWDDLYAVGPTASTPLDFAWLRGWWRVYGPSLRAARYES